MGVASAVRSMGLTPPPRHPSRSLFARSPHVLTGARPHCGWSRTRAQAEFFVRWISIENGLELVGKPPPHPPPAISLRLWRASLNLPSPRALRHLSVDSPSPLEQVVEFFNYLASVNSALGSPVSFYIALGFNLMMVLFELIEVRRTRRHGGKQTMWDCFWFGQVSSPVRLPTHRETQPMPTLMPSKV